MQINIEFIIQIILFIVVIGAMILSIRFSIQSRHGAQNSERNRHVHGKLNMSMGALMLGIAGIQLSAPIISTPRYIFVGICVLLGGYNLFAGFKNWKETNK